LGKRSFVVSESQTTFDTASGACHVFVRPEGGHFVGLCAELREIISGNTIDDIVEKTKLLAGSTEIRVQLHTR
jgi:hypothetical protein